MAGRKKLFEVRPSKIQGWGGFAIRPIPKGTRIVEYKGERISTEEGDRRYPDTINPHPHTLLFSVDEKTMIDAAIHGNEARFINHSCEPNCIAVIDQRRVYIQALRDIKPGEELAYDYNLARPEEAPADIEKRFACHCGAATCRGTMLAPLEPKAKQRRVRA